MKFLILPFFLSFISCVAFSQGNARATTPSFTNKVNQSGLNGANRTMRTIANLDAQYKYNIIKEEYKDIDGSPYLFDEEVLATIVAINGGVSQDIPLKLDLYVNEFLTSTSEGDIFLDTKFYKSLHFEKDGERYVFKRTHPKHPTQFYEVLFEKEGVIIFKKQEAKLRQGVDNGIAKINSVFRNTVKYYISNKGKDLIRTNLKEKSLFKNLPTNLVVEMEQYIQNSREELKEEKDYRKMFMAIGNQS